MTKNEALKKCIDGAKIRHKGYRENNLIYFDGEKFVLTDGFISMNADGPAFAHKDGWQIVPEYVDFATAWKAYEEGKNIKSYCATYCHTNKPQKRQMGLQSILISEIRGQWLILEDEYQDGGPIYWEVENGKTNHMRNPL